MMKKTIQLITAAIIGISLLSGCNKETELSAKEGKTGQQVDGYIQNGLRYITIDPRKKLHLRVYRGDYIVPQITGQQHFTFTVPALAVKKVYPVTGDKKNYIKMKKTGIYKITIGDIRGSIEVVDYTVPNYREVNADEAKKIIHNIDPVIIDVRTAGEFQRGHIKGALLIPVQELQYRLDELEQYKEKNILLYCATGNRSTVSSKILIDQGFKRIHNLRYGIAEWYRNGYPLEH